MQRFHVWKKTAADLRWKIDVGEDSFEIRNRELLAYAYILYVFVTIEYVPTWKRITARGLKESSVPRFGKLGLKANFQWPCEEKPLVTGGFP